MCIFIIHMYLLVCTCNINTTILIQLVQYPNIAHITLVSAYLFIYYSKHFLIDFLLMLHAYFISNLPTPPTDFFHFFKPFLLEIIFFETLFQCFQAKSPTSRRDLCPKCPKFINRSAPDLHSIYL